MSSNVKGVVEVELKTDRFVASARKIKESFKDLEMKGKQNVKNLGTTSDKSATKLKNLGTVGKQAADAISRSATNTKQSVDNIGRSAAQAKQQISTLSTQGQNSMNILGTTGTRAGNQIAQSMNNATNSVRNLSIASTTASRDSKTAILGIATLGTSAGTTYTSISALNKAQLKLDKSSQKIQKSTVGAARAQDLLRSTQLAIVRFTNQVNKLQAEGKTNTDAYAVATENLALQNQKLGTAQDDLKIKLGDIQIAKNDAAQAAEDLNDTYINMSISIANTALTSAFMISMLAPGLTKALIAAKLQTIASSRALKFLGIDLNMARLQAQKAGVQMKLAATTFKGMSLSIHGASLAVKGLRISLIGLRAGIKATYVAIGPIGWAIIGISVAYEALAGNVFGVTDALVDFAKTIEKYIPLFNGLSLAIQTMFPDVEAEMIEATEEVETLTASTQQLETQLNNTSTATDTLTESVHTATTTVQGFQNSTSTMAQTLAEFYDLASGKGVEDMNNQLKSLKDLLIDAKEQGLDPLSAAGKQAFTSLIPSLTKVGQLLYDAYGAERFEEFEKNIEAFGFGFDVTLNKNTNTVRVLNSELDKTTDKLDSLKKNYGSLDEIQEAAEASESAFKLGTIFNGSRIPLDTWLRSEFFGNGKNLIKGLGIDKEFKALFKLAGIKLGGTGASLQYYTDKYRRDTAKPHFETGGRFRPTPSQTRTAPGSSPSGRRSGGSGVAQYSQQRYQAKQALNRAQGKYAAYFGSNLDVGTYLPRRGVTSTYYSRARRVLGELDKVQTQLSEFGIGLNFDDTVFRDRIGTQSKIRHTKKYGSINIRTAKYGDVTRTPTKQEAIYKAYEESLRVEKIYNEIQDTNKKLAAEIAGLREEQALIKLEQEKARIKDFANRANDTIDFVKSWLRTQDGEYHLENQIKYRQREIESVSQVAY